MLKRSLSLILLPYRLLCSLFGMQASLKPYGALAGSAYYAYGYPYTAPIGPDGNVVDTPEVAAAKAAHFAAHAAAQH